jgi:hypothetical protein
MKSLPQLQKEMRQTSAGRLLVRAGFEPWDTESSARRVAKVAGAFGEILWEISEDIFQR